MKSCAQRLIDVGAITQADGFSERWNVPPGSDVSYFKRCAFILKTRMSRSEYTMNIFYIIGVVVVIIFVASFLGLHA
jgi:hypothetical protein